MKKALFVNSNAIAYEMKSLSKAKDEAEKVVTWSADNEINLTDAVFQELLRGNLTSAVDHFRQKEQQKINAFESQFGTMAMIGNSKAGLDRVVMDYHLQLKHTLPVMPFEVSFYFDHLQLVENSVMIKPNAETIIKEKHTVYGDNDFFQKHSQVTALLNELFLHPDNEFIKFFELFYFNPDTKELEINLTAYDIADSRSFVESRESEINQHYVTKSKVNRLSMN